MNFKDQFHLTKDQNRRFARMNFTKLVHTNARFEGINTTLPQTQTIMDGLELISTISIPLSRLNVGGSLLLKVIQSLILNLKRE